MHKVNTLNTISFAFVFIAKLSGIAGVACSYIRQVETGKILLLTSGLFIVLTILLCLYNCYKVQNSIPLSQKLRPETQEARMLRKLMEDGSLGQHLKNIGYNEES